MSDSLSSGMLSSKQTRSTLSRVASVLIGSVLVAASSVLMIGPQIVVIVPVALILGVTFALRRSAWSLVCVGYILTFGFVSSWIGYNELNDYLQTNDFIISTGIGAFGFALVLAGFWMALSVGSRQQTLDSV
ncbi:hypothetical protein OAH34_01270 [bacterium]|nr:hypothetical protein [bacterium]